MRIACTGFVAQEAGSVASANALLLRELLGRGCQIDFFSKARFVDPRPAVGSQAGFSFINVENHLPDRIRARLERIPGLGLPARLLDTQTYNELLVRRIAEAHAIRKYDLCIWLGAYATGAISGLPTVSFAQGPPGTDARSLIQRFDEVARLAGRATAERWRFLARLRLSRLGLPKFRFSDAILIGSSVSSRTLQTLYGIDPHKIHILPYPIDLNLFSPAPAPGTRAGLHCLWLGRVVPRKRLDLFLDGAAEAIRRGADLQLTLLGEVGFVPGYEKLAVAFPFPDRLTWLPPAPRGTIPGLMHAQDLLCQPSDEENFGSSVAEAQACGLPVIVGSTNGNADFLSSRDIRLPDDRPESLAAAFLEMARRKTTGSLGSPAVSRQCAETHFALPRVADALLAILSQVSSGR